MYTCRACEREINAASEICPYCGEDLTAVPAGAATETKKKPAFLKRLLRWGLLLAALCGFLWYILFLPERAGNPTDRAERQAIASLQEILRALSAYADAQGGRYPQALDTLGQGIQRTAQQAQSEGYQLEYVPGESGESGSVSHFALLARPRNYGYRSFYADESGVLRATLESREATAKDPPISAAPPSGGAR
jgi:hypothetical protein